MSRKVSKAASDAMRARLEEYERALAEKIAADLFTAGDGQVAERLALVQDSTGRNLGGYCRGAVVSVILKHLLQERT